MDPRIAFCEGLGWCSSFALVQSFGPDSFRSGIVQHLVGDAVDRAAGSVAGYPLSFDHVDRPGFPQVCLGGS